MATTRQREAATAWGTRVHNKVSWVRGQFTTPRVQCAMNLDRRITNGMLPVSQKMTNILQPYALGKIRIIWSISKESVACTISVSILCHNVSWRCYHVCPLSSCQVPSGRSTTQQNSERAVDEKVSSARRSFSSEVQKRHQKVGSGFRWFYLEPEGYSRRRAQGT